MNINAEKNIFATSAAYSASSAAMLFGLDSIKEKTLIYWKVSRTASINANVDSFNEWKL